MADSTIRLPTFEELKAARQRLDDSGVVRTPLQLLNVAGASNYRIFAKCEQLQPSVNSFKLRAAVNAVHAIRERRKSTGSAVRLVTASAGNMGAALAHVASSLDDCELLCVVPDGSPTAKIEKMRRMGARVERVAMSRWWQLVVSSDSSAFDGDAVFVHPCASTEVLAGNGTVALEIVEQLAERGAGALDCVLVPYGGGALACGVANALREAKRCGVIDGPLPLVFAVEVEGAAPLSAALDAGKPVDIDMASSWVDGIGSSSVLADMFERAAELLDGSIVVPLADIENAFRHLLLEEKLLVEGAGAVALAAVAAGHLDAHMPGRRRRVRNVACILSGAGIDTAQVIRLLSDAKQDK
jgi:threonine dehydratase